MQACEVCGNEYDKIIEIKKENTTHFFDSFECAIHALAPHCEHCDCTVIGHGVESDGHIYCCVRCAEQCGEEGLRDRKDTRKAS